MADSKNRRATALSVSLPMEMAQAVYQQVRDGTYHSAGAVIREALRQLLKLEGEESTAEPEVTESPRRRRRG
jgi:putative addiction module CopG family antidote